MALDSGFRLLLTATVLAGLLTCWLIARARGSLTPDFRGWLSVSKGWFGSPGVIRFKEWIDDLATERESRYQVPWLLILGEAGAGKTSLIHSVDAMEPEHRAAPHVGRPIAGLNWVALNAGLVIDPSGSICAAPEGSREEKTWLNALKEIVQLRPERPVDGIVLAISARTLLEPMAQVTQAAQGAFHQLEVVQQQFEFLLPVYVVVTQCDVIEGFTPFWGRVVGSTQDIVGWSAPASADSQTPQEWVGQAFAYLSDRLKSIQLAVAGDSEPIPDVDRFFLFPRHLRGLDDALTQWLAVAFRSSPWTAGHLFRGLYFTGSREANGDVSGRVLADVDFSVDLITRKALAERGIARPTREGIWSRNTSIRLAQRLAVGVLACLLVALAVSSVKLERQVHVLGDSLRLIRAEARVDLGGACPPSERVFDLMNQIGLIPDRLPLITRISMPLSNVASDLRDAANEVILKDAFGKIIMPGIRCELERKARDLDAEAVTAMATSKAQDVESEAVAPVPANDDVGKDNLEIRSRLLFSRIDAVQDFEAHLDAFRYLSRFDRNARPEVLLGKMDRLLRYAYGSGLPQDMKDGTSAFGQALATMTYDDERKIAIPPNMRKNTIGWIARMSSGLRTELGSAVLLGPDLVEKLQKGEDPIYTEMKQLAWWLGWVQKSWLNATASVNPCSAVGNQLERALDSLGHFSAEYRVSPATVKQFSVEQCYVLAREKLAELRLAPYGSVFIPGAVALELNPKLAPEIDGMQTVIGLDYMRTEPRGRFACRLSQSGWDPLQAELAIRYIRQYQAFHVAAKLPDLSDKNDKPPLYDRLARYQLERVINDAMEAAQRPVATPQGLSRGPGDVLANADQSVREASSRFSRAVNPMLELVQLMGELQLTDSQMALTDCVRRTAVANLRGIESLADASHLYEPPVAVSSSAIYDLGSIAVTKDYLARQIARARVLADYASPFVGFLRNTEGNQETGQSNIEGSQYWGNTITELSRALQANDPAGSVGQLDSLLVKQLRELTYANCSKSLPAIADDAGNDLFSQRQWLIAQDAQARCGSRTQMLAYDSYRRLADRFNVELARRYPFGSIELTDEVSAGSVRAFFADYVNQRESLRQQIAEVPGARWKDILTFLDQLDAVASFLQSNVLAPDGIQPIRIKPGFHALPGSSAGSAEVVSWALRSADSLANYPNGSNTLNWVYGNPIALDLQWADHALYRPIANPSQSDLAVTGRVATASRAGNWALLRFIQAYRSPVSAGNTVNSASPLLLEFKVPVQTTAREPPIQSRVSAYTTLTFGGTDDKVEPAKRVIFPGVFPDHAPRLRPARAESPSSKDARKSSKATDAQSTPTADSRSKDGP